MAEAEEPVATEEAAGAGSPAHPLGAAVASAAEGAAAEQQESPEDLPEWEPTPVEDAAPVAEPPPPAAEEPAAEKAPSLAPPPPAPAVKAEPAPAAARRSTILLQPPSSLRMDRARARLRSEPEDAEAWGVVLSEAQSAPLAAARPLFEELVAHFPTAASVWTAYAEAELRPGAEDGRSDEACRALFARCLLACPDCALWQLYLRFVALSHDSASAEGVAALRAAHEFALERLGEDVNSGPLWTDYLRFLRAVPAAALHPSAPGGGEGARTLDVRKAFAAATSKPLAGLEGLWRDYEAWENAQGRQLARPLIADAQPRLAAARAALPERRRLSEAARAATPLLPVPAGAPRTGQAQAARAWRAWSALLTLECDPAHQLASVKRGALCWDQALSVFPAWPELWLAAARWHALGDRLADAAALLARGAAQLPRCLLVRLARAEAEEEAGDAPTARALLEALLQELAATGPSDEMGAEEALAWVALMRFARRSEGPPSARKVFASARARPSAGAAWRVYLAAAEAEWRGGSDPKVARNILELGMKAWALHPPYIVAYASFLVRLNDAQNARVLFERTVAAHAAAAEEAEGGGAAAATVAAGAPPPPPPPDIGVVWDAFLDFEHQCGSLGSARAVDARRAAAAVQQAEMGGKAAVVGGVLFSPPPAQLALETAERLSYADLPVLAQSLQVSLVAAAGGDAAPARPAPTLTPPPGAAIPAVGAAALLPQPAPAPAPAPPPPQPRPVPVAAPPPAPMPFIAPAAPMDPLSAAGLHELRAFLLSLPPTVLIAHLPIPSPDAVLHILLRADPSQLMAQMQAHMEAQLAPYGGQMGMAQLPYGAPQMALPYGGGGGLPYKRSAEEAFR